MTRVEGLRLLMLLCLITSLSSHNILRNDFCLTVTHGYMWSLGGATNLSILRYLLLFLKNFLCSSAELCSSCFLKNIDIAFADCSAARF